MSEGHPEARHYVLAYLWSEARLARRRINAVIGTQTLGFYVAAATVLGGGKGLNEFIENLQYDEK